MTHTSSQTDDPHSEDEKEQRLIDSLLQSLYQQDDHAQRIAQVMAAIGNGNHIASNNCDADTANKPTFASNTPSSLSNRSDLSYRRSAWIWVLMSTAAILLLTLPLFLNPFQSSATAKVQQSLDIAKQNLPRRYNLHIEFQKSGEMTRSIDGDLYVQGSQYMAVRIPAIIAPNRDAWAGHNEQEAWVVPAFGPVMVGDQLALGNWLRSKEEVATPYLHLTTLLSKMITAYDLENLPAQQMTTTTTSKNFDRIQGTKKADAQDRLPDKLELWIDPDSGFVQRLEAFWSTTNGGVQRILQLQYKSDNPLPENWFDHQAHHIDRRRVVHFDKPTTEIQ